jgi:hypothetical protein
MWLAFTPILVAQEQPQPQLMTNAPSMGTFYLLGRIPSPPYPFDPYFGTQPVYAYDGVFFVDDTQVSFTEQQFGGGGGMMLMSGPTPPPCDPCSTNGSGGTNYSGPLAYSYDPTNVWLEITGVTNGQAFFVVKTPDSFETFDMFSTTNLTTNVAGLNLTNWLWLTRTASGQTNLVLTNLWPGEGWFKLGTMLDSDSDGLPDAFEILVSKTNPQLRDTDNDTISDGDEMGPNGLPWGLEQARRSSVIVYANTPTATEGGSCGQVTVYLPAPAPPGGVTVQYRFGGTALPAAEFTNTPTANMLTIAAGQSSGTIAICAVNDTAFADLDRYVEVTLTNASCCTVDSQPARVTLVDNDPPEVRVFAFPAWVRKPSPTYGTNTAGFYFIRDGDAAGVVTASFSIASGAGAAQSGVDFNPISPSSVTFPAGVRTNLLNVVLKPTTNVADKTLTLTITSVSGYQIDPAAGAATMTIASSTVSLPVVQVMATDDDARETGTNTGTFTFTRSGPSNLPLRVYYRVSGTATVGSNNSERDYTALPEFVDFAAGRATTNVFVRPVDDDISETMETVVVTISAGEYQLGVSNTATVYIDDNEPVSYDPEVLFQGVHGASYNRPLYTKITRYGSAVGAAALGWTMTYNFTPNVLQSVTASGHASGSQVQWPARQSVAYVNFTPTWIGTAGQSNATYTMTLQLNGDPFQPTATYRPQGQVIRLTSSAGATNILEGTTATGALIFTRPHPSASSIVASYGVDGSAVSPTDYTGPGSSVSFAANVGGSVTVNITAPANPLTNGWRTGVVKFSTGPGYHGDEGYDRMFFRIRDAQVSNPVSDTDMDNDGLKDGWELVRLTTNDPTVPNDPHVDPDRDGLGAVDEMQLGTNPDVADAAPVYPSEDPDDYAPLTLFLGSGGKLADQAGCAACHQVGVRAGPYLRYSPTMNWEQAGNTDALIRFLRGTNYPVGLLVHPYNKVLSSAVTNSTPLDYTASYTAQFLVASNRYPFVTDTTGLFGTNQPLVTQTLPRNATLFVPDLLIAADVDRDGIVNTTNRVDRTEAQTPFTFWINDDSDFGSDDEAEDRDPSAFVLNKSNTSIDGLRDLEDFSRLHFRVEGLPGGWLTNANMRTRIYLTNLSGTASLRLFRATEANGGGAYLTNESTATLQLALGAYGVVTNGTPLTLIGSEWKSSGSNRFFLPTIFEGVSTGRCVVVFAIATNNGPDIAVSRPFYLELRRVTGMYEHWTVGDNYTDEWIDLLGRRATRATDSATFGSPQTSQELDYILFAHGWRMQPWERRAFASTSYKRLWQLGYRGRFGLFSWPTDWTFVVDFFNWSVPNPADSQNYDRSERRAWHSAQALRLLLSELNRTYPNRVRLMAHSMGNVAASEALHLRGQSRTLPLIHTYIASQAAIPAHAYDAVNPVVVETDGTTDTPEVYASYPVTGLPYLTHMTNAVNFNPANQRARIFNYHNSQDFALVGWLINHDTKPDIGWEYKKSSKRWWRLTGNPFGQTMLNFPGDTYEIFSHMAESRSEALGADGATRGQVGNAVDLNLPPYSYGPLKHEHSAQFGSILMRRRSYWQQLRQDFQVP